MIKNVPDLRKKRDISPLSQQGLVWQISSGVDGLFAQAILPPPLRWGPPRNAKLNKH